MRQSRLDLTRIPRTGTIGDASKRGLGHVASTHCRQAEVPRRERRRDGGSVLRGRAARSPDESDRPPQSRSWDAGLVRHLLPTVSDSRILVKASFERPLSAAPGPAR